MICAPLDTRILRAFPGGFDLATHTIGAATMGSHSHNTYVPKEDPDSIDDVDIMAIVVPPPRQTIGLREWEHLPDQPDFEAADRLVVEMTFDIWRQTGALTS